MRRKHESKLQFLKEVLFTAMVLFFLNLILYGHLVFQDRGSETASVKDIMPHLSRQDGYYILDPEEKKRLKERQEFAMLLNLNGEILWEEFLPSSLRKTYTIQDVALFSRYYLENYPVHTYVVEEGLLVIGEKKDEVWKYNLEYGTGTVRVLLQITPLLFLLNLGVMIAIPLLLQKRRQRQREEERTEWIAGVSHDIRTPLAIIMGNAEAIGSCAKEEEISDRAPEILRRANLIEKEGVRLRSLVENLNLSSKLDFGSGRFEKQPVQISRLLRKILTEILNQTEDEGYEFELDIDENMQEKVLEMNPNWMERSIFNLIHNAMRHNPGGCRVSIRLYQDEKGRPVLVVEDDGRGVSEEVLHKLNRKNYEWEPSGGRQHGLGLKIVKQVTGWHKWEIGFEAGKSGGFTCRIRLK